MLNYIITFFMMAVIASILGFGGIAADFAGIARFLAGIFVVLFVASLIYNALTGRNTTPPL